MTDELKLSLNQDAEGFLRKPVKHATLPLLRDWNYIALNRAAASGKPLAAAHGKSANNLLTPTELSQAPLFR